MRTPRTPLMMLTTVLMVALMLSLGLAPQSMAAMVGSEAIQTDNLQRTTDLQTIQTVLEQKLVRERLKQVGYSVDEIQTRLDRMSDAEIHRLAQDLDQLQPGGWHGVVVAVLLVVLIVAVFLALDRHHHLH